MTADDGQHRRHAGQHQKPYVIITTTNPDVTLEQGVKRRYKTFIEACNGFAHSTAPYRTILHDDGCEVRELDQREEAMLERACELLGQETERIDG
jgi:hypothetical protein